VKSIELSIQNKKDLFNHALSSLDGLRENDISMYQKLENQITDAQILKEHWEISWYWFKTSETHY